MSLLSSSEATAGIMYAPLSTSAVRNHVITEKEFADYVTKLYEKNIISGPMRNFLCVRLEMNHYPRTHAAFSFQMDKVIHFKPTALNAPSCKFVNTVVGTNSDNSIMVKTSLEFTFYTFNTHALVPPFCNNDPRYSSHVDISIKVVKMQLPHYIQHLMRGARFSSDIMGEVLPFKDRFDSLWQFYRNIQPLHNYLSSAIVDKNPPSALQFGDRERTQLATTFYNFYLPTTLQRIPIHVTIPDANNQPVVTLMHVIRSDLDQAITTNHQYGVDLRPPERNEQLDNNL